jgi:hypothetical protein
MLMKIKRVMKNSGKWLVAGGEQERLKNSDE